MFRAPLSGRACLALPALLIALSLTGCSEAERSAILRDATSTARTTTAGGGNGGGGDAGMITTNAASWSTNAREFRDRTGTFAFDCPANPSREGTGSGVWGSGPYTDDSSVCKAGVQSGVITYERGGRVRIQTRPGQNRYVGSSRNDVRSNDYGSYGSSFIVVN